MIICQFIFKPGAYDEEFHRLDKEIDDFAKSLMGYVGVEAWYSDDRTLKNATYYFESMDAVRELARFPAHIEAKSKNARWYDGYQIIVSEVARSYGDGRLDHLTA